MLDLDSGPLLVSADTGMDQAYDMTWHGIGCDEGRASWIAVVDGSKEEGETLYG